MADRSILVRLRAEISDYKSKMQDAALATNSVAAQADKAAKQSSASFDSMVNKIDKNRLVQLLGSGELA